MKTVNVESIVELIEAGNGSINSYELASMCNAHDHTKFVKKMGTVLFGVQRDSISMDELHEKISGHPNVRAQKVVYNLNNIRDEYLLSEREATLMAMTYSYELQAMVYDAYVVYRENTLKALTENIDPYELMIRSIKNDYMVLRGKKRKEKTGKLIAGIFDKIHDPLVAIEHIYEIYNSKCKTHDYKIHFLETCERIINNIINKLENTPGSSMYTKGEMLNAKARIVISQRAIARNNDTRKESALEESEKKSEHRKEVALIVGGKLKEANAQLKIGFPF